MAVSHQWFIQWLPPSMVFADVNREYQDINNHWNEEWSPKFQDVDKKFDYYNPYEQPDSVPSYEKPTYKDDLRKPNLNYNGEFKFVFNFGNEHINLA